MSGRSLPRGSGVPRPARRGRLREDGRGPGIRPRADDLAPPGGRGGPVPRRRGEPKSTSRIAPSRTATRDQGAPILYRPLPDAYGEADLLRAVRRARRRAEAAGADPSLVEIDVDALRTQQGTRPRRDRRADARRPSRVLGGLLQPRHRHA